MNFPLKLELSVETSVETSVERESRRLNALYEAIEAPEIPVLPLDIPIWSAWLKSSNSFDSPSFDCRVPRSLLQAPGPPL